MLPLKLRWPLRAATLGAGAMSLCMGSALADPAPAFADLLAQAQATAPKLAEARANVARAEGLARQAGALSNPVLGLEVENFSGSGPYEGGALRETTASVEQTLELGGKRSSRVAAGRADVEAARAEALRVEAEYAFELASAYAEAEAADRRLALARETLGLAEEDARIATALVEAGREADLRRLQARAAVQAARAQLGQAQAARAVAFENLTAMAGARSPITSIPVSLLDSPTPLMGLPGLTAPATAAFSAAQADREAAARRLTVERRRAIPDVTVSVGLRRFEEDDTNALIAGVSVPLPLFDRNRGNVAAARAEVSAAEARLNAARLEAEAAVRTSQARIAAAESRLSASREGEAAAQEAYRLARIGYEAGKLPLFELVAARRALAEANEQMIAAAVERIGAQAAQARMVGQTGHGELP